MKRPKAQNWSSASKRKIKNKQSRIMKKDVTNIYKKK